MDEVRIGIIRIGNMGSGHSLYLYPGQVSNAELTAVCDIHPDRIKWAREKPGWISRLTAISSMKNSGKRSKIPIQPKQAEISTVLDVSETY